MKPSRALKGRGAPENPPNRFETLWYVSDEDAAADPDAPLPKTRFLKDDTRSIISRNDSPDVPFDASINPYRGCEHGCVYCYARPTHEYLGFSAGLDFETNILVKVDAPELLRKELSSKRWKPQVLAVSGVTDAYQPGERRFGLTRRCLEVLEDFRNPVTIVTKNRLVTRDLDLLQSLSRFDAARVCVSVTTLDPSLTRVLEPRTSTPARRLETIRELGAAGIPTTVLVAPIIPGLNDSEIPAIVAAAAEAGASSAGYVMLRLPHGLDELFSSWLERHLPGRKTRILSRIREMRGGESNDPRFGSRMSGSGVFAEQIAGLFRVSAAKAGLDAGIAPLSAASFRRGEYEQATLFDD